MNRLSRQSHIPGWDQDGLAAATVVVVGRGWLGTFAVWALSLLGVGRILWVGAPRKATQPIARWLLTDPFEGAATKEFPSDPLYDQALHWVLDAHGDPARIMLDCAESDAISAVCRRVCDVRRDALPHQRAVQLIAGSAVGGGWIGLGGLGVPSGQEPLGDKRIVAMIVAALLIDVVRTLYCPLESDLLPESGRLCWPAPAAVKPRRGAAVVVGVGGIGMKAAALLAARGHSLLLADHDHVDDSNRNRQSFSANDACQHVPKALAAHRILGEWFPQARIMPLVQRVDADFARTLARVRPRPKALVSAVDNAATRLVLQQLGSEANIPVLQAGTDLFSADCYCQLPAGTALDEQMCGALSNAARREAHQRRDRAGCDVVPSYIVPGMIAGAMLAWRFEQVASPTGPGRDLAPWRWRQGLFPQENRSIGYDPSDLPLDGLSATTS